MRWIKCYKINGRAKCVAVVLFKVLIDSWLTHGVQNVAHITFKWLFSICQAIPMMVGILGASRFSCDGWKIHCDECECDWKWKSNNLDTYNHICYAELIALQLWEVYAFHFTARVMAICVCLSSSIEQIITFFYKMPSPSNIN